MTLQKILSKLGTSKAYKDFKKSSEGKNAFLCATFIILNLKQGTSENSLDFRNDKDIFTFKIPSGKDSKEEVVMLKEEIIPSRKQLKKIDESEMKNVKVEPESLQVIIEEQLKANKITGNLEEVIAVLQTDENKELAWHLTCIVSGFVILTVKIDATSKKILKFEKKNLLDFVSVKKPGESLAKK